MRTKVKKLKKEAIAKAEAAAKDAATKGPKERSPHTKEARCCFAFARQSIGQGGNTLKLYSHMRCKVYDRPQSYDAAEFEALTAKYEKLNWRMISKPGGATVKPDDFYQLYGCEAHTDVCALLVCFAVGHVAMQLLR